MYVYENCFLSGRCTGCDQVDAAAQVCDAMELVPAERLQRARDLAEDFERSQALTQGGSGKVALSVQDAVALLRKLQGVLQPDDGSGQGSEGAAGAEAGANTFECVVCMGRFLLASWHI
jgi:hypothetical protein